MRPNLSVKRGFTLIELLVVIAIIAILAAILFPVFAQARAKARQITCLSNVRQCATAFAMYVQDYDETMLALWGSVPGGGCGDGNLGACSQEWWFGLFPYIKSVGLLYCTERNEGSALNYNLLGRSLGITKLAGYGYNWGPIGWRGGGLLNQQQRLPSGQTFITGRSLAAVQFPAATYAFGDTYDTPRMTLGIGFAGDTWTGFSNSALRHMGGMFQYAFVDGHAKAIRVRGGLMDGAFNGKLIMPRDAVFAANAYCSNPDEIITRVGSTGDSMNVPDDLRCGDIPGWIVANYPPCSTSVTSNCLFTD